MANFDLSSYETVKERKRRFYTDHPDGRIIVMLENNDVEEKALFRVQIFLNGEDQIKMLPRATGYAMEIRDKEKSLNKYGKEFESVNYSSWVENCEESAIGRALDNAGYSSNGKCSREEIEKSQRMNATLRPNNNSQLKTDGDIKEPSSAAQQRMLYAVAKSKGLTNGEMEGILLQHGFKSFKEIPWSMVNDIKDEFESWNR